MSVFAPEPPSLVDAVGSRRPAVWGLAVTGLLSLGWLAARDFVRPNPFFHPHGYCYLWESDLVGTHVASDALIAVSYLTISITLVYLVRETRREIPFSWMLLAFGTFIVACGMTHAVEILTLWKPWFWLAADVKIVTAVASVATAVALPPLVPRIIKLVQAAHVSESRRRELERVNRELQTDARDRAHAEARFRGLLEAAPDAIVIVDGQGTLVLVNSQAEKIFQYTRGDLLGRPIELLIPDGYGAQPPDRKPGVFLDPNARPMGAGLELNGRRSDGTEFPAEISVSPLTTDGEVLVMAAIRDITERKALQHRLEASLREKELLLKEVHHRVKNNLAVMSSLFYLQSTYTQDPSVVGLLQESQHRVRSMALVHERLYGSQSLSAIEFGEYAQALAEELRSTYDVTRNRVQMHIDVEPVTLGIDIAVPCGLILNELISNAFKHAFPNQGRGTITVRVRRIGDVSAALEVIDDGVGVPESVEFEAARSLGLRLIRSLTRQLRAVFVLERASKGTIARLTFPLSHDDNV